MKQATGVHLTRGALFLALGLVLPFFTGQVPQIGQMLLPMHIPVFLCAFICGPRMGAAVAVVLPLLRTALFGVPLLYPDALAIAGEMAAYALVTGLLYRRSQPYGLWGTLGSMLPAMVAGRVIRAALQLVLLGFAGKSAAFGALLAGITAAGLPGVVLQLVAIPAVMLVVERRRQKNREKP